MKLKGILLTSALTAMLGVGVFAGVSGYKNSASVSEVKAQPSSGKRFIFFKPTSNWDFDGAKFAAWCWGGDAGGGKTYVLNKTSDSAIYYFEMPTNVTGFKFVRTNSGGATDGSSNYPNPEWGATGDLSYSNNNNLYTMTSYSEGSWSSKEVPSEDGYYLTGSAHSWSFASAVKMTFNSDYSPLDSGDIAVLYKYTAATNEEIKVRSFKGANDDYYNAGSHSGFAYGSVLENGNFKFNSSANNKKFDIFFNGTNFYVTLHKERYTVTIVNKLYDGATCTGSEAGVNQMATETEVFNPTDSSKTGYVFRAYYTNEECTSTYVPNSSHTAPFTLYAKMTRDCYYMFGDETFMGAGHGWDIDTAHPVAAGSGNNRLEGVVTIPNSASSNNPVKVKPLRWNGNMVAESYSLGESRTFVSIDGDGNFSFTEGGNYAFYINNNNQVWFNIGEYVFHTKFLTEVGGTCVYQGGTNIETLQDVWADQKLAYNALSAADKKNITDVGFDGGNEKSSDDRLKMIAMYHYIVTKYGSAVFEDFIWGQTVAASSASFVRSLPETTETAVVTTTATVVVTVIAISTAAGFLFLKKKKNF